jgi:isoquinoline 1-oxidoreductase beta subunit
MALAGPTALPSLKGTPEIVVKFLPGSEIAGGLSGLGTLPVAPAIANAIAAGAGKRMRNLPFDAMGAA